MDDNLSEAPVFILKHTAYYARLVRSVVYKELLIAALLKVVDVNFFRLVASLSGGIAEQDDFAEEWLNLQVFIGW